MTTNGQHNGKPPNVAASVSEFTHNVIELSELQVQLLALDAKQSVEKARTSVLLAVVGACVLLGTIPVALLSLASLFYERAGWSMAASAGTAAAIGLLIAGAVLAVAWAYIKKGLVTLDRSREELRRNIAWLKSTLRTRGQAHTPERPINY